MENPNDYFGNFFFTNLNRFLEKPSLKTSSPHINLPLTNISF